MDSRILTVRENVPLTGNVYRMTLTHPDLPQQKPGQFINIQLPGLFLRRPISVYDSKPGCVTIIYKEVGTGTHALVGIGPGTELDVLTGLGNGYDIDKAGSMPLLLGGGVGVPPLYYLARQLRAAGTEVTAVLGFNTREEVFAEADFRALGCRVMVMTADGSYGMRGFVTDGLPDEYSYVYTCGPMPMLRAVYGRITTGGQFSFEERMGCGFGACMGCTHKTKNGYKRVCREGPVFEKEEILWDD